MGEIDTKLIPKKKDSHKTKGVSLIAEVSELKVDLNVSEWHTSRVVITVNFPVSEGFISR